MTFCERLIQLRGKKWRQREIAVRSGIDQGLLSTYEADQRLPSLRHLVLIADVYELTVSELLHNINLGEQVYYQRILVTNPLPFDELPIRGD